MKPARKKEWFDSEGFWRELYPFMFPEKDMAEVDARMAQALKLANPRGKTALDLCCGAGRYSIALAKRGFSVTGVDLTKYLLDRGREAARAARVRIKWVRHDMRDFVRPDSFAFVLSMFSSFGYFDDQRQDMKVLGNSFRSLEPGGVLLIDLMNMERLVKMKPLARPMRLPDGSSLLERHEILDDRIRVRNERSVTRNGKTRSFKYGVTVYSAREMRRMMERSGFVNVKLYGSLNGDKQGKSSQRLIVIARKPISKRRS
jgi:SAM-dependent methyltransferase